MHRFFWAATGICFLSLATGVQAGLHYSGESFSDLPSQWSGFLLDQRALRNIAVKPTDKTPASPARLRYLEAAEKLEKLSRERNLGADEWADLGALYCRLGEIQKAVDVLRKAQREHAQHFRIISNLGTAWQLQGDLDQAAAALQAAVRLAPGKWQKLEEYQLQLVRFRKGQPRDAQVLDDLFGIQFVGDGGQYEAGKLAPGQRKKLPADAAAVTQQLGLWLPADGKLLWQLAELANALGDVKTAAAIMDGCVNEFGLKSPELRRHRQITRAAADELAKLAAADSGFGRSSHETHSAFFKPRSKRPLAARLDPTPLPPIKSDGINAIPWSVVTDTTVDRKYKPTFSKYLQELNGKQIELCGFMQPLGEDLDMASFMLIEYPVGCWYCEMPEVTGIVLVELPAGQTATYTRGLVKVQGKLKLNASDPENFLYTISKSTVKEAD
jgi:hypothetical protein